MSENTGFGEGFEEPAEIEIDLGLPETSDDADDLGLNFDFGAGVPVGHVTEDGGLQTVPALQVAGGTFGGQLRRAVQPRQ